MSVAKTKPHDKTLSSDILSAGDQLEALSGQLLDLARSAARDADSFELVERAVWARSHSAHAFAHGFSSYVDVSLLASRFSYRIGRGSQLHFRPPSTFRS